MKQKFIFSLAFLVALTGCKINVSGSGEMADTASGAKQEIDFNVYSKNKGRACEVYLTLSDAQGETLYELRANPVQTDNLSIDTSEGDCNRDAKVILVASAKNRVVGSEWVWEPSGINFIPLNRPDIGLIPRAKDKVLYDKVVTDVQGEIRDRATGRMLKTFTATSEVRFVEVARRDERQP